MAWWGTKDPSVQRGQVGQPSPDPVSRTTPPVTTMPMLTTRDATAARRSQGPDRLLGRPATGALVRFTPTRSRYRGALLVVPGGQPGEPLVEGHPWLPPQHGPGPSLVEPVRGGQLLGEEAGDRRCVLPSCHRPGRVHGRPGGPAHRRG